MFQLCCACGCCCAQRPCPARQILICPNMHLQSILDPREAACSAVQRRYHADVKGMGWTFDVFCCSSCVGELSNDLTALVTSRMLAIDPFITALHYIYNPVLNCATNAMAGEFLFILLKLCCTTSAHTSAQTSCPVCSTAIACHTTRRSCTYTHGCTPKATVPTTHTVDGCHDF